MIYNNINNRIQTFALENRLCNLIIVESYDASHQTKIIML